jgi:hypothetical protein
LKEGAIRALQRAIEIQQLPIDLNDDNVGAVLRAITAAGQNLLQAQLRVDETQLQEKRLDRLPEILRLMAEEERKLKLIGII